MDSRGVQAIEADLMDHQSLHEALEGVDTVYNMASPMPGRAAEFMKVNTEGILNLLEVATEVGVKTVVHLSTVDVCGFGAGRVPPGAPANPTGDYQKAKAEAERLLAESAKRSPLPRVVVIRSARAFGSRDWSLAAPLLQMIETGKVVLPSAGPMSFSHPLDVAKAMLVAGTGAVPSGSVFHVKSFDARPEELARGLVAATGAQADVRKEGLLSRSQLPAYTLGQLRAGLTVDADPGWKELGYAPGMNLQASCEEVARWYKKEPWAAGRA
jgi:dTDP-glucose 4,6-dehydratase